MAKRFRVTTRRVVLFSLMAFLVLIIPHSVFAKASSSFENTPRENSIRTVPALQDNGSGHAQGAPPQNIVPPVNPVMDAWRNPSPLSAEDPSTPLVAPPGAVVKKPSEQEISALVDNVFSNMVEAGHGADLSQVLAYISTENYTGFASSLKENPGILDGFIKSLQEISGSYGNSPYRDYANSWLQEAEGLRQNLAEDQSSVYAPPDPLVEAVRRLYDPFARRILEVTQSLESTSRISGDSGIKGSSVDPLKNFSNKAKEFILDSFNRAQANLANGILSNPLEATAFAAETAAGQKSPAALDQAGVREMTLTELYVKSKKYRVVDSAYIGKDFIYAQKMLHPPANLHPYLKWLLYTRNLTPRMVENYLATREAVGAIYEQAKAGRGNIRYRDKVYGAFLPFAETAVGNYELVKPASAE